MSMDEYNIVEEIQRVLDGNGSISTATKDRLMLTAMRYVLISIEGERGIKERIEYLEKFKPHLQVLAWAASIIAGAIVLAVVTGKLQLVWIK